MNKYIISLILMLVLAMLCDARKKKEIVIVHTNDTHSQIYPFSPNLNDTLKAGRGGYDRRMACIEEMRNESPNLLLFDSGDFSQGSPYYTMYHGDVEVGLMNLMRYDAVTIGNHEFDFGMDNMARIFRMAEFPVVCSNYDFTGTPCEGIVKDHIVIHRNGVKIGVFGLSPKLQGLAPESSIGGVMYRDPISAADEMVTLLRKKKKCDLVVCLSHLGYDDDDTDVNDTMLVAHTKGIDMVLGGHSHTILNPASRLKNCEGKEVVVGQNGKSGLFLSRFNVKLK